MASCSAIWAALSLLTYADFSFASNSRSSKLKMIQMKLQKEKQRCTEDNGANKDNALNRGKEVTGFIPVFFNILPHFLVSVTLMAEAGQLFSHSVLMLKLLFSGYSFFFCLQVKVDYVSLHHSNCDNKKGKARHFPMGCHRVRSWLTLGWQQSVDN